MSNARRDGPDVGEHILRVRLGHGANCSSVGSVVDTLFVVSAVSGALLAAIAAAIASDSVRVVGGETPPKNDAEPPPAPSERAP